MEAKDTLIAPIGNPGMGMSLLSQAEVQGSFLSGEVQFTIVMFAILLTAHDQYMLVSTA